MHLERSTLVAPSGQNNGVAFNAIRYTANTVPTFRIIDSTITGNWVFYQGYHILEGTTELKGVAYSTSNGILDCRNASIKAYRTLAGTIELSKVGSGGAVTSDSYKIYYAFDESAFEDGTAIEYTEPIADVDKTTPIYVALGRTFTYKEVDNIFYSTSVENILSVNTGDIDGDDGISVSDLASLRDYFLDDFDCEENLADINGDGFTDARDLVRLKLYLVNLE